MELVDARRVRAPPVHEAQKPQRDDQLQHRLRDRLFARLHDHHHREAAPQQAVGLEVHVRVGERVVVRAVALARLGVAQEVVVQQRAREVRHRDGHAEHDEHQQRAGENHHEPVRRRAEADPRIVEKGAFHRLERFDAHRGQRCVNAGEEEKQQPLAGLLRLLAVAPLGQFHDRDERQRHRRNEPHHPKKPVKKPQSTQQE